MSDAILRPQNVAELQDAMRAETSVLAVGNQTKPTLGKADGARLVSMSAMSGIVEYEPSEFTFTALAGTPVAEVNAALAEKRQYLPFDPLLVEAGATLAGTVASGTAGPGRFRYGGIRDFLLGVQFVTGDGQLIHSGGKVVKNAAGFDLPKFLVGSLGRMAVMTEMTFKVFPQPPDKLTLKIQCANHTQALERMSVIAASRWEADAIEYRPSEQQICTRLRGPQVAIDAIAKEIQATLGDDTTIEPDADAYWEAIGELNWTEPTVVVKVPCSPDQCLSLTDSMGNQLDGLHWSVAGNVLWFLASDHSQLAELDVRLMDLQLPGLVIKGDWNQPCTGAWPQREIEQKVKDVMDPNGKFPGFAAQVS